MTRTKLRRAALASFSIMPAVALAQERPYEWGWGMMLMMFLFWGLIIVGLVVLIRWLIGQSREARSDSALEILRQRYARGEISKEQFDAMRRDLSS